MKDELATWRRGIDLFRDADKLDASPLETLEELNQMRERASCPIQFPQAVLKARYCSSSGKAPVSLVTCKETGVWKGLSKTKVFQRGSCQKEDAPYTLNEREHLRLVTRLRIWGRSSESFAREWDRGGRFDWLPELAIPGRGHADFSLEGFAKGHF